MPMVLVDQSRPPDLRRDRGRAQPKAREKRPVKRRLAPSPKGRRADRVATPPVPLAPDATPSEPALDTPGEPRLAATAERVPAVDTSTRDLTAPAAPQGLEPLPAAMPLTRRGDVMLLVRELLERSDELVVYHLGLVAQAIVEDVIENLPADAACVLVDDHGQWRVEGASGLREVETQLVLTDDHWLVAQTVRAGSAVAIEDTDIARVQLRGAPLASWPYLMAEGTPDGKALVIAVRDLSGEGFSESDVVRVADLCQEGQRYLAAAREVRALVRRLSDV